MSILCLICKEKLLSYNVPGPGGSLGALNHLVENVVISTACGHLFHFAVEIARLHRYLECIQSWFRTQKRKLHMQGFPETESNLCPSCQSSVSQGDLRSVYPLEDHREALEKARLLERQENLEIYCHQLEVQLQQLQRENDIFLNKILTPPASPMDDYDTIVKNDRVVWMKKGDAPLTGVVLSIFKKEGKLCAKIKLDRKIRPNQRTNRILSSFRLDKKQELTVPFEEIVLERDVNQNVPNGKNQQQNSGGGLGGKSLSSANIFQTFSKGNEHLRNSTLSLPDESRRLFGIQESLNESSNDVNNPAPPSTNMGRPHLNRSVSYSPGFTIANSSSPEPPPREISSPKSINSSNASLDQQRDYVFITPSWMKNQSKSGKVKAIESRSSPPDGKNKHVTFADDPAKSKVFFEELTRRLSCESNQGDGTDITINESTIISKYSFDYEDNNYENIMSSTILTNDSVNTKPRKKTAPPAPPAVIRPKPKPRISIIETDENSTSDTSAISTPTYSGDKIPTLQLSLYETITRTNIPVSPRPVDQFSEEALFMAALHNEDFDHIGSPNSATFAESFERGCFDVTLLSLLYCSNGFDQPMLMDNMQDNEFCRTVKWIVREKFAAPLRQYGVVQADYAKILKESMTHLCSGTLDVEELITILFEFTYKMPPFLNYSLEMCDYLHQFFIDFTDKIKVRTVQQLLEKSLLLQDNLRLENGPTPALILQMPHSEDGIIHYDAVIPNLVMKIDHILDKGTSRNVKKCYCDNVATLECKTCSNIHGSSAVLFCENCKELLEEIHSDRGNNHPLQLASVSNNFSLPSTVFSLSSIICWKDTRYSVFLKDGTDTYSPWIYVHGIVDGKLQMKQLPGFGYWLENLASESKPPTLQGIPSLLKKVFKHCRVFVYVPLRSSEV